MLRKDSEVKKPHLNPPLGKGRCRRGIPFLTLITVFLIAAYAVDCLAQPVALDGATAEVYFSPNGGCTDAIVAEIGKAKNEVLVQAYSFTSAPIADALVEAHMRGLNVEVILDKSQAEKKYSSADFVSYAGIATLIDRNHAIAHNKIILIDRQTIITGSFNFSKAAEEKNAENLLVIKGSKELAGRYNENFQKHLEHSVEYGGQ